MRPSIEIGAGETEEFATIEGCGRITHIWIAVHPQSWRSLVLRAYWDGASEPAMEVPLGDFFCLGLGQYAPVSSLPITVNPYGGLNSYWPMPFADRAGLTIENLSARPARFFYQVTYELQDNPPSEISYFHAQWRRSSPLEERTTHQVLARVTGAGHYVGTYLAWMSNESGWWGEGEVRFFLDGDDDFPTINGTGTEDYVGGAWCFTDLTDHEGRFETYSTPYLGLPQVIMPNGRWSSQRRFGMYRWHVEDPIRFRAGISVDIQALGFRSNGQFKSLRDDIASTAMFYLDRPSVDRPSPPNLAVMDIASDQMPFPEELA